MIGQIKVDREIIKQLKILAIKSNKKLQEFVDDIFKDYLKKK